MSVASSSSLLVRLAARWKQHVAGLARLGSITLFDQSLVSACNFLTGVLLGRVDPKEFGIYSLGFTLIVILSGVLQAVVAVPYTVFVQRLRDDERPAYAGGVLAHFGIFSLLAMTGVAALAVVLWLSGAWKLGPAILVLAAMIPLMLLREFCRRVTFAHMQLRRALAFDGAAVLLQVGTLGTLSLIGGLSAASCFLAIGLSCGVVSAAWLYSLRERFQLRDAPVRDVWRRNWRFSKWVVIEHSASILHTNTTQWILAAMLGTTATGLFAACAQILNVFNPIVLGLNNVLMPRIAVAMSQEGAREVRRVVQKATLALLSGTAVFCVVIVVFGSQIIRLLYGDRYAGQEGTITILAIDMFVQSLATPAAYGLWAFERSRTLFFVRLVRIGITVPISVALIPHFGPLGAAWGLLSSNLVGGTITWMLYNRLLRGEQFQLPPRVELCPEEAVV